MSGSKYPPFERLTAGRLKVGDRILIRDRRDDHLPGMMRATGEFEVLDIDSELRRAHTRSTRFYTLSLYDVRFEQGAYAPHSVTISAVQRVNRIVP